MSRILYLLLLLILCACSRPSETERYAAIVKEWQGKEIKLPHVMTDALTGDTIDLSDTDFIILTYVDSVGCTSCKMKLPLWHEFLCSLDTLTEASIETLTIVNAPDSRELTALIKRDGYSYPVYLDSEDCANTTNAFPDNANFQTFLLDRNRRVIALGNPILNNSVAALYKSIISGQSSLSSDFDAIVKVSNADIKLGTLTIGQEAKKPFTLTNLGNDTIHIRNIISSCHCSQASLSSRSIPPMSSINGEIRYREDSLTGPIDTHININFENFDYPSVIRLKGNVNANK
ncbi:DUF1573 domain-containing protein [uncultured Duncaniella sp.]|jgi:hypothetical protein|uniref:DUF1573 domain-containing protein n=2 Tax=Bacteroidia TaxID=200643 RepID=UPI000AA391D8|nr:DUF1573 domain-containing protein [uncultured Duncaniella sp.]